MKNPIGILLIVAVLLVAALGLWVSARPPVDDVAPAVPAHETAQESEASPRSEHEIEVVASGSAESSSARESAAIPKPETPAAAATPTELTVLEATFVDDDRVPITGVHATLSAAGTNRSAESTADGRVRIEIPLEREAADATLRARVGNYVGLLVRPRLERGRTTRLGDLVMHVGGEIAGIVLGPDGSPFEGARVSVAEDVPPSDPDRARVAGPDVPAEWPRAKSRASGVFQLAGVPVGRVRVWATAEGMRHVCSDAIEVAPRQLQGGITLRLEPLARDERIEGIVLAPDGKPVPGAELHYRWSSGNTTHSSSENADKDGRFRVLAPKKVPFDLRAADPQRRWQDASSAGVVPGTLDVVLQLRDPRWIELSVVADSKPVTEFSSATKSGRDGYQWDGKARTHEGGRERLIVPAARFWIKVTAPGCSDAELGPFDPDTAPRAVVAELQLLPGLQGRVLADGKPVSGASLELHQLARRGDRIVHNGYPSRLNPNDDETVTSDGEGRYRFTAREAGDFAIVCTANGYALAERSPIEVVPAKGVAGLDVTLVRGGAIEGRLLVPAGQESAGVIVSFDRGDARTRTLRTGADGSFRVSGLTPGRWNVARAHEEISPMRSTTSTSSGGGGDVEIPWNCLVEDGRTTRFDVDVRDAAPCVLNARVEVNQSPAAAWSVHLMPEIGVAMHDPPGGTVDTYGDAHVEVPEPGTYRLELRPPPSSSAQGEFSATVKLARGSNSWRAALDVGALEASGGVAGAGTRYSLDAQLAGGVAFHVDLTVDESGSARQSIVAAGACVIRRTDKLETDSTWTWREAGKLDVDVPAGGVKHVTLP